ncbi:hypothetical protein [Undibacterium sp. Ji22W]|uniref:hypothetical protein n=1 Tax=Undibacterium sp. Ji22W TaxID=3413038 RepID=UPI003BF41871
MDAAARKEILSLSKMAHDLTESSYQKDPSIRGESGWSEKQRILLADMALHLLQTALRDGELSEENLKRNLFSILTISDQFLPGYELKKAAASL